MRFGILLFDDVEVLDAFGPFEVFSVARRLGAPLEVVLVSAYEDRVSISARGGLRVQADVVRSAAPEFDLLLVPGGDTAAVEGDAALLEWLASRAGTPVVASVCTGAFLLAGAGILTDQAVTTHWEDVDRLQSVFPGLDVRREVRWVRDGDIYTSAGISAGIDLALELVSAHFDGLAERVARQMDYRWQRTP